MKKWKMLAAAGLMSTASQYAHAGLMIDFRAAAGTGVSADQHSVTLSASQTAASLTLEVWATVTPAGGLTSNVGISNLLFRSLDTLNSGSSPITGLAATGFATDAKFGNVGDAGTVQDNNGNSITDIGKVSGAAGTTGTPHDAKARAVVSPIGGAAPGYYSDQGGWVATTGGSSYKIGTLTVSVAAALNASGSTTIKPVAPVGTAASPSAVWFENVTSAQEDAIQGKLQMTTSGLYTANTTGVTYSYTEVEPPNYEFVLGSVPASHSRPFSVQTISLTSVPNHTTPYFTPGVNVADPTKGEIQFTNLDAADSANAYVLLWFTGAVPVGASTNFSVVPGLLGTQAIYSVDPLGAPNGYVKLPTAATTGYLDYDFITSNTQLLKVALVPEPASLGLLTLGALGLVSRRRRPIPLPA